NVEIYVVQLDIPLTGPVDNGERYILYQSDGPNVEDFNILQSFLVDGPFGDVYTNVPVDIGLEAPDGTRYLFRDQGRPGTSNSAITYLIWDEFTNTTSVDFGRIPPAGPPLHDNVQVLLSNLKEGQRLIQDMAAGNFDSQGLNVWFRPTSLP